MVYSKKSVFIVLHNIRSATNVGSIFRTADAVGVMKIYLTGYTPKPVDRFDRPNSQIIKTALGAEKSVSWEFVKNPEKLFTKLKQEKVKVVAVEQAGQALDYKKFKQKSATAFVFGNEVLGIDHKILKICDGVIEIPMRGKKESLNVAVAVGVVLFRVLDC